MNTINRPEQQERPYREIIINFDEDKITADEIEAFIDDIPPVFQVPLIQPRLSFERERDRLEILRRQAERNLKGNRKIPSLNHFMRVRMPGSYSDADVEQLIKAILTYEDFKGKITYIARADPPPLADKEEPQDGSGLVVLKTDANTQGYLYSAVQGGVNAEYAWAISGGNGAGVQVCDCELGFGAHIDLPDVNVISTQVCWPGEEEHGTNVLGILAGKPDDVGVTGICHGATMLFASEFGGNRTQCFEDLLLAFDEDETQEDKLHPGDVILLEMQSTYFEPAEIESDVHTAITTLGGLNLVVVAAAGNACVNLTTFTIERIIGIDADGNLIRADVRIWDSAHEHYDDSGAILVGAGHAPSADYPHSKIVDSAYGSRVNCQGWGEGVRTTSSGNGYTNTFGGTSAAAAMVAGVVACLQGYAKNVLGNRLQPSHIRHLLSQNEYGTAQTDYYEANQLGVLTEYLAEDYHIGPLPDLKKLIEAPALRQRPDVYMRDYIGDTGEEPSTDRILYWSPDIIARKNAVTDIVAAFGGENWDEPNLGENIEYGQPNYIYVRLQNRGDLSEDDAKVQLYWAKMSTFLHPLTWTLVGELTNLAIAAGERQIVGPIVWRTDAIPEPGSYCLIGVASSALDFVPIPDTFESQSMYEDFVRFSNNICWRNVTVVDVDPNGWSGTLTFWLNGLFAELSHYQLEIDHQLPLGTHVVVKSRQFQRAFEYPKKLDRDWPYIPELPILDREVEFIQPYQPTSIHRLQTTASRAKRQPIQAELELLKPSNRLYTGHQAPIPPFLSRQPLIIDDIQLQADKAEQVQLKIEIPKNVPPGDYMVVANQYLGDTHLGRINYLLRVKDKAIV
ncbi:MAG: S8 family serine peptidase [Ardenticatenaceae bacterium]|nr:S8 family serine peptidase [Ardenticatenaceae bacterium]